jgi:hypothetical protein
LSKAAFDRFFKTADAAGWPLNQDPAHIPIPILDWTSNPVPTDHLGTAIINSWKLKN